MAENDAGACVAQDGDGGDARSIAQLLFSDVAQCLLAAKITRGLFHVSSFTSSIDHREPRSLALGVNLGSWRSADRAAQALHAVALIARYSTLLSTRPRLHLEFWTAILTSPVTCAAAAGEGGDGAKSPEHMTLEKWMRERESHQLPIIELNFFKVRADDTLIEMLRTFLTTDPLQAKSPPPHVPEVEAWLASVLRPSAAALTGAGHKVRIALRLPNRWAGTGFLVKLWLLLDQVYSQYNHFNRQFAIYRLDLSSNAMSAADLKCATEVLKKNDAVYRIEELVLGKGFGSVKPRASRQDRMSVQLFIQTLFKSRSNAEPAASTPSSPPPALRRVCLDNCVLTVQDFAAICSAVRYGCPFEELSLASVLGNLRPEERALCWHLLVFALFIPRPPTKRLFSGGPNSSKCRLRTIDLSDNPFDEPDSSAVAQVVYFRASALGEAFLGDEHDIPLMGQTEETPRTCTVTQLSNVHSKPDAASPVISIVERDEELEILYDNKNGWLWVVVAGEGFGWVQENQVASIQQHDWNDCESKEGQYALILNRVKPSKEPERFFSNPDPPLNSFVRLIGRQLRSFSVRRVENVSAQTIVESCAKLEHLDLEASAFKWDALLKGFDDRFHAFKQRIFGSRIGDPFGRHLKSLNVSRTNIYERHLSKLAGILSEKSDTLPLEDLRFAGCRDTTEGLGSLLFTLRANKRLVYLEMDKPADTSWDRERLATSKQIESTYNNELLRVDPLPLRSKLAMLSAATSRSAGGRGRTIQRMDTWMLSLIFQFARSEVRRKIVLIPEADDS